MTSADCARIEEILDRLSTELASPEEQFFAAAHAGLCGSCRRLLSAARGEADLLAEEEHHELARSVVELTSGPACGRARESLCETLDAPPEAARDEILALHVAHCPGCRRFAATLQRLREALPEMSEIDPGSEFTAAVIRATSRSRGARIRRFAHPARVWHRVLARPRFAWEAAYAGTLALVLVFVNPWLPVRDPALQVLSAIEIRIPSGFSRLSAAGVVPSASEIARTARNLSAFVAGGSAAAGSSIARRADQAQDYLSATAVPAARRFLSQLRGSAASLFSPRSNP